MSFSFGKRLGQVDWRKLASVDIDRVAREMDVKTLQDNILHVTYCNIEAEFGMQAFDPNYIKLFRLAQYTIEYLLHSQEYLSGAIDDEQKKVQEALESAQEAKKALAEREAVCSKLKKEVRKQKEWIAEYQLLMRAGASGIHKCHICAKTFVSQEYLMGHLTRRHGEPVQMNGMVSSGAPVKTVATVSVQQKSAPVGGNDGERSAVLQEMREIKERLHSTERELANEKHARESQVAQERDQLRREQEKLHELEANYEQWKSLEQDKHKKEMAAFKKSLVQELNALQMQKESVSQALSELEKKMSSRPSMIGTLQDDDETDGPRSEKTNRQMMAMVENQLGQMKAQTQEDLHKELQKLQQKWKSKEQKTQQEHKNELQRFQDLLNQHEENLKNEQLEKEKVSRAYEGQIKRLSQRLQDHERALENQKAVSEEQLQALQSQNKQFLAPPPVARREPLVQESMQRERARSPDKNGRAGGLTDYVPRERAKSPDKSGQTGDVMTLYVSANPGKNQFRLWRQSADSASEWKDRFSFKAHLKPNAGFNFPLYVYASGGSPYWRQYISQSNQPPSAEYRLDYMFYASRVARTSTVQLHVFDAGSVPVIRSCVSESADAQSPWRSKGLTFHAVKLQSVRFSLSDAANLSGSWDAETSVTEDKNDSEESEATVTESETPKQTPEPPKEDVLDDDEESSGSAEEIRELTSGLSSSEWGTATLEPGEYHPIPRNPFITSRYNHSAEEVNGYRQEVMQVVEQKLVKLGLNEGEEQLSSKKLEARMAFFLQDRQSRIKKVRNFMEIRERCAQDLDQIAKKTYAKKSPAGGQVTLQSAGPPASRSPTDRPPRFKAAATAARTTAALIQPGRKTPTRLSSTGSVSGGEMTLTGTTLTDQSFSGTSVTEQTLSESEDDDDLTEGDSIQDRPNGKDDEDDDEEEESDWDSISEAPPNSNRTGVKPAVKIPSQQVDSDFDSDDDDEEPQQPLRVRSPSGERVKQLAATLERSLTFERPNKKPTGGVALLNQSGTQRKQLAADDVDEFDRSSDELDSGMLPGRRGAGTGTSAVNSAESSNCSRAHIASTVNQRQPPSSAVRAFTDDFSDDDDLDIQHIT